jgi:hypothetical protein
MPPTVRPDVGRLVPAGGQLPLVTETPPRLTAHADRPFRGWCALPFGPRVPELLLAGVTREADHLCGALPGQGSGAFRDRRI